MSGPDPAVNTLAKRGLILAGGGARAAYQVGVLKAIARMRAPLANNPFPILCGTSAGAINAAALAIYSANFHHAVTRLVSVWSHFSVDKVFRSDFRGVSKSGLHWLLALLSGGLGRYAPSSFFDRQPLEALLRSYMPMEKIAGAIEAGHLHALSVTASGYTSGQSVTFYQGVPGIEPWDRAIRVGCPSEIGIEHLMASSAIPFFFEAVKINREYFGDGSMRQIAPISPALHLGAEKVLVIGVRGAEEDADLSRKKVMDYPSLAQIAGHALNSIFLDSMDVDLERLERINRTVELIPQHHRDEGQSNLRPIQAMVISPSRNISNIAQQFAHRLPRTVRYFLKGIGALNDDGTSLLSYLLFDRAFCRKLIALGYADTVKRREEMLAFLDE